MTKREQLQKIVDDACERNPEYYSFFIKYRAGWWAIPSDGMRWFGDKGEFLGRDFSTAKKTLLMLLP